MSIRANNGTQDAIIIFQEMLQYFDRKTEEHAKGIFKNNIEFLILSTSVLNNEFNFLY